MRKKWMLYVCSSALLMGACSPPSEQAVDENDGSVEQVTQTEGNTGEITTTNPLSGGYYRPLLEDGKYMTSNSRGITMRMNSSVNLHSFETGLMRLSQKYFPSEEHLFQEGQLIPSESVSSWLRRKSEDNPEGLNPPDNGNLDEDGRNPNYLSTILEQNYYRQTDEGNELAGISIGLGMNQIDYYKKEQFGADFQTQISREVLLEQGQRMADNIVRRLRDIEHVGDRPIMIAIFEQAPRDNLAGGVYIAEGVSEDGSGSIDEWLSVNERKEVFPLTGSDTNEGNSFRNFKSEVESFFPNLSGVTGIAHYQDDQLGKLDINLIIQFYGAGEVVAFTQYVRDAASKFLPPNIEIEVSIESMNGMESFLVREAGETAFQAHIFTK